MKKTYQIEVDCANCANLMEQATKKTDGVADATVNFMTQKMIVEFAEGADPKDVMKRVLKACKKVEPDCEIELCPSLRRIARYAAFSFGVASKSICGGG